MEKHDLTASTPRHNNRTSGGNHMSLAKNAARRTALFAGASSTALALVAVTSLGASLAPSAASAQTALCVAAPTPATATVGGNGTADVTLPAATYNPAITCAYTGTGAEVSTAGPITVSTTAPGGGVNLAATGTSAITWNSSAGTVNASSQTNGPVIEALSEQGAIDITVGAINRVNSSNTITDGIRAVSTQGGAVTVNVNGAINIASSTQGDAAIEAISSGGNGDIHIVAGEGATLTGRLYGIRAEAAGSGEVTITLNGVGSINGPVARAVNGGGPDSASIYAKTRTGMLRIDAGVIGGLGAPNASALKLDIGGDAALNFTDIFMGGNLRPVVDLTTSAGGATVLTHSGVLGSSGAANTGSADPSRYAATIAGAGDVTINSDGLVVGYVTMADHTGSLNWFVNAGWNSRGPSQFGSGNTSLVIAPSAQWIISGATLTTVEDGPVPVDFAGGSDRVSNAGVLVIGPRWISNVSFVDDEPRDEIEIELVLENLESFDNSGTILLGGYLGHRLTQSVDVSRGTDLWRDDMLSMPGAHFVGSGDSRIMFDVDLNNPAGQGACDASLRDPVTFDLPAADCVAIQGGSTEGTTLVTVRDLAPGDRGAFNTTGVVLVDVSGGTSAAGHFVLDPQSDLYSPIAGGVIDKGIFVFPLVYDAETQQHKLVAAPSDAAYRLPLLGQAAQGVWRLTSGSWFDRQADLRGGRDAGFGGGVWLRTTAEFADRDVAHSVTVGTRTLVYDNTLEQSSYAVTGGLDLLSGAGADSAYALGVTAGYAHADVEFASVADTARLNGASLGGYASLMAGGLFVDASVTANRLTLRQHALAYGLTPADTLVSTDVTSTGGQVEAGWRVPVMERLFVEPLAGVSYVRSWLGDMPIVPDDASRQGVDVEFEDSTSLRAHLGARLGLEQDYGPVRAQYVLLGRLWNEFEGETGVILHNIGADAAVSDEFNGQFSEFGLGVNLYGLGEALSGFLNFGGKFGDDYEAESASAGIRVNW